MIIAWWFPLGKMQFLNQVSNLRKKKKRRTNKQTKTKTKKKTLTMTTIIIINSITQLTKHT